MKKKEVLPKEYQYKIQFETLDEKGPVKLGPTASHLWRNDPRHLVFLLSRYKFCSKILTGKKNVLEVGCGEGFGTRIVLQTVGKVHGIDFDPLFIDVARELYKCEGLKCDFSVADVTKKISLKEVFDAAYTMDLIEHIASDKEDKVMSNIVGLLSSDAVCIVGTPNITAHAYASPDSIAGHINLKSSESLKKLMEKYFKNVMIFSMNDEVVHTGFYPMAHYLIATGIGIKERNKEGNDGGNKST